jgi:hypothetical protein
MPASRKVVLVTFAPDQWKLVSPYVGKVGIGNADTVRNIVIHWILDRPGDSPSATGRESSRREGGRRS